MQKFLVLILASQCFGAPTPQEGFGDASPDEIAQIRAGTYLEMFDDNPQYTYNFKVADDDAQTYIAQEESRAGDSVTGSYSYVDPLGSLITVTYTAGPMGYQEERNVQANFVTIRATGASGASLGGSSFSSQSGASSQSSSSGVSSTSSFGSSSRPQSSGFTVIRPGSSSSTSTSSQQSSVSQSDIISAVVSQVQPLISQTVSSAVAGARPPPPTSRPLPTTARPRPTTARPLPTATSSTSSNDIIAQVVSQIAPLVSQTVSSAVAGASRTRLASNNSGSRTATGPTGRGITRVRVPVAAPQPVQVAAPAPLVQITAPGPREVPTASTSSRTSGSVSNLFGDGNFNVRFNTPDFQIEY